MSEPRVLPICPPHPVPPGSTFAEAVDALNERIMASIGVPAELCYPAEEKPMNVADAFLADILATPDDDAPRLIFADWLEEHGDEARAEFIRVQCDLEPLRVHGYGSGDPHGGDCPVCFRAARLERRERELLLATRPGQWSRFPEALWNTATWQFRRGFVEEVCLSCAAWEEHGPALCRAAPLTYVVLSDRRPWHNTLLGDGGHEWAWMGAGNAVGGDLAQSNLLPPPLYALLACPCHDTVIEAKCYRTDADAVAALSAACLAWARAATPEGGGHG